MFNKITIIGCGLIGSSLLRAIDKKRLSKRHAATNLDEYRSQGYLDSAIINTLARLGWSKGDNEVLNYLNGL